MVLACAGPAAVRQIAAGRVSGHRLAHPVRRMALPAHEVESIFADIVERARALDPANARKWFDQLAVLHFDGGSIRVGCPD